MGLDDTTYYFSKEIFSPVKKTLFLGYPTIIKYKNNGFDRILNEIVWESCDITQNNSQNHKVDICEFDKKEFYDLLVDHGTLQHIIDPISGLKNFIRSVKKDGEVIHVIPFSGFNGFGFWQFSPELFVCLERKNIIKDLKIYVFDDFNRNFYVELDLDKSDFRLRLGRETRMFVSYNKRCDFENLIGAFQEEMFSNTQDDVINVLENRSFFQKIIFSGIAITIKDLIFYTYLKIVKKPIWFCKEYKCGTWRRFDEY
jgi:hypothetical protein